MTDEPSRTPDDQPAPARARRRSIPPFVGLAAVVLLVAAPIVLASVRDPETADYGKPTATPDGRALYVAASDDAKASAKRKPRTWNLAKLEETGRATELQIDNAGGQPRQDPAAPIVAAADTPLRLSGWTLDAPNRLLARGVAFQFDGIDVPVRYGIDRSDIADAYYGGIDYFDNAGFEASVPAELLTPGEHALAPFVIMWGEDFYYRQKVIEVHVG